LSGRQKNCAMCCLPRLVGLRSSSKVQSLAEQHRCVACVSIQALTEIRTRRGSWPILTPAQGNRLLRIRAKQDHMTTPNTNHYQTAYEMSWRGVPPTLL